MSTPHLAVTMGDPAGIGPELCVRLLASSSRFRDCTLTVLGSREILAAASEAIDQPFSGAVVDFGPVPDFTPGTISRHTGAAAARYLHEAIKTTLAGDYDGIVTCPLNKEALALAGISHPGHTEILVAETRAPNHCMMLTSPEITCSLVTTHCALAEVPTLLTTARISEVITLTAEAMGRLRGHPPRLTVLGLNPHAGEGGLFGDEEDRLIAPAIAHARESGLKVSGPLPPDTAFLSAVRETTDAYICMYHDQGLIPLKTLAFEEAVNVTLGLPLVRTSVDHGTALDIAWQGKADPSSLMQAVQLATRLCASG